MIVSALNHALYAWLDGATTWPVVLMEQNAPRPNTSYVGWRLGNSKRVAEDYAGAPDAGGDSTVVGNREMIAEVQAYGSGARQQLENCRDALSMETVRDILRNSSCCVIEATDVQNLSTVLNNAYEERALLEVRVRTWSEMVDRVGWIEHVSGDATVVGPDSSVAWTAPLSFDL
jgi:hypothetical protein